MPRVSKVDLLNSEQRQWLDRELVSRGFAGYEELVADCRAHGIDLSVSGLGRYGKSFKDRLERVRLITEQARAVVAESPDDEGAVNEALMRLVQERLFDVMVDAQFDVESMSLDKVARAIADLGRASISQKKLAAEVRRQALEEAATQAEQTGRKQGLSDDGVDALRKAIMAGLS